MIKNFIYSLYYAYLPTPIGRNIFKLFKQKEYISLQKLRTSNTTSYSLKSFDKYKCIFVHIPKTGGISVVNSLFGNLGGAHVPIRKYQFIFSKSEFNTYFKFAIVRNPWDRLVSAYTFLMNGGLNEKDKSWAEKNIKKFQNFEDFVKWWVCRENIYSYVHFVPQHEFICIKPLRPSVDFIGYLEDYTNDFNKIKRLLGVEGELQKLNVSKRRDYKEYYNDATLQIVADAYRDDINLFGYDFNNMQISKIII